MWSTTVLALLIGQASAFSCKSHALVGNHTTAYQPRRLIPPPVDLTTWNPLRISFYLVDNSAVNSQFTSLLNDDVLPSVASLYSKALTINPLADPKLKVVSDICDDVSVPDSFLTDGVDADVLIFVTVGLGDYQAWASICQVVTDEFHRPQVGHIHLQGDAELLNMTWGQTYATVAHQAAHVLAFNNELFPFFLGENGEFFGAEKIVGSGSSKGIPVSYIKSPNVLEKARNEFGCDSLNGLELEGRFPAGDSSVHWEKRVMYGDFMVASVNPYDAIFSDISFALFEDSGWYRVDYDYTSTVVWGYKRGCSWLFSQCIIGQKAISTEFCDSPTLPRCDYTYTKKGACSYAKSSTMLFSGFQYFGDPYTGGTDDYADNCPIVNPDPEQDCTGTVSSPEANTEVYGESICPDCRCIEGTFVSQVSTAAPHAHTSCHKITCEGSVATITIGQEVAKCLPDGQPTTVRGYQGLVYCPTSDVLCRPLPCYENCHGHGVCNEGKCQCEDGWTGDYCESAAHLAALLALFAVVY